MRSRTFLLRDYQILYHQAKTKVCHSVLSVKTKRKFSSCCVVFDRHPAYLISVEQNHIGVHAIDKNYITAHIFDENYPSAHILDPT